MQNALKYPADLVRGSSAKYTTYTQPQAGQAPDHAPKKDGSNS